ncbi:MAG: bifunctional [glutamate--ammonia ligase]-adenylyl-L-tyrosine phosphorylase/[glutamate--ammonia-ligase] adenylyltransferase [Steroidobacteraceae bacterium]
MSETSRGEARIQTPDSVRESLDRVLGASDFVGRALERDPALLDELIASGDLLRGAAAPVGGPVGGYCAARVPRWSPGEPLEEADFMGRLRRWRRREMVRIAYRDLAGWAALAETLAELSAFADAAIDSAYRHARTRLTAIHGEPCSASGGVQPLTIIAMGKLGGRELNFSSDIDLVFLFPEHGHTAARASAEASIRSISNEEFFTRLGQMIIRLLGARTEDGFVFRVDMRLRPFGESGPLAVSFASFEDYLQRHGRDWERYAWVKARPITGIARYAELYASAVRPFVYRRYLDYGVFESLREMKGLIEREVERRELADDVKLGPGGIREIEFVVQALQLIRGGRDARLQTASLLAALPLLDREKLLPAGAAAELGEAYDFLRRLENRLQMLADEQTHRLPKDQTARMRVAQAMGASDWSALLSELDRCRSHVRRHFRAVVFAGASSSARASTGAATAILDTGASADRARLPEELRAAGFGDDAAEAARLLEELRDSPLARKLDETGRRRLEALLPALVTGIGAGRAPLAVLKRVLRILEAIGPRSAYFALLNERGEARTRLTELAAHGDFLASQIAAYPLLLDELVDERVLRHEANRAELAQELRLALEQAPQDDPERQVEALRHFQQAATFHVAVADLTGRLPVMRVSDRLTEIAELIVESAMMLGWRQITAQYGVPLCGESRDRRPVAVCAIGYGKLGGLELGYASDLDLVFLHDSAGEHQQTDAQRPTDNGVFFVRFAQRILHLLTMHSAAGRLYEVDVRLRPSGKGGLLLTSIQAFARYQAQEAWTWEHQALLHARAVAGSAHLAGEFERVRMDVLQHHVRRASLREDVRSMRERMRRELTKARPGEFDIKQDAGGIADIEFLAQYWALLWAQEYPPVARYSDTIRQLESVASANLVPQGTVDALTAAYRTYRTRAHHLSLEGRPAIIPPSELAGEREAVSGTWERVMSASV